VNVAAIASLGYHGSVTLVSDPDNHLYAVPTNFWAKWQIFDEADISGALETDGVPVLVRELHKGISAGLGVYSEPWKWWQSLGAGLGQIDDNFQVAPVNLSDLPSAFRDRSPINGDAGLGALLEWGFEWLMYPPSQETGLGFSLIVQLTQWFADLDETLGLAAQIECLNLSALLRENDVIRKYELVLTGAADSTDDITLPISSIQGRLRSGTPSYLSVQIPSYNFIEEIIARANGEMQIWGVFEIGTGDQIRQIISSADLDDIRSDRGGKNNTITLAGHRTQTFANKTTVLTNVSEIGQSGGKKSAVADVDFYLRPGDTVIANGESFVVGLVSFLISVKRQRMEVVEA
jgi:hypothetical protein